MAIASPVCGVIDALSNLQQQIIDAINGKFAALRRLAQLLEKLGDLTGFIPDISKLIPISALNISLYENLRNECKFLNLPPSSGDPGAVLGNMQAQLHAAYGRLLGQLNLNPLSRMSQLQDKLDQYQQQFNMGALGGVDFMQCLQAACQAAVAAEGTVSSLSNTSAAKIRESAETYLKNIVEDQGKLWGAETQAKIDTLNSAKAGISKLMDVPVVNLPNLPK